MDSGISVRPLRFDSSGVRGQGSEAGFVLFFPFSHSEDSTRSTRHTCSSFPPHPPALSRTSSAFTTLGSSFSRLGLFLSVWGFCVCFYLFCGGFFCISCVDLLRLCRSLPWTFWFLLPFSGHTPSNRGLEQLARITGRLLGSCSCWICPFVCL